MTQTATNPPDQAPRWQLGRELDESGHIFTRLAGAIREDAIDKEEGLLKGVCFSTGARGLRYDAYGDKFYEEELAVTPEAVNLERFTAGVVPVLDTHQQHDLNCILGAAVRGWVEGGECLSDIRLTDRPDAAGRISDIKAGITRATSVGYTVQKWEFVPPEKRTDGGKLLLARAVRWTPHEFSFVPVPFDANSSVRSLSGAASIDGAFVDGSSCAPLDEACARKIQEIQTRANPAQVPLPAAQAAPTRQEEPTMNQENAQGAATAAAQTPAVAQSRSLQEIAQITALGAKHGWAADIAGWVSNEAMTLDKVRAIILDDLAAQSEAGQANQRNTSGTRVERVRDEAETRMMAIGEALAHRMNSANKLTELGRSLEGIGMLDLARQLLRAHGQNTQGLSNAQLAQRALSLRGAHTTGDFQYLLADSANKELAASLPLAETTFKRWARKGSNFRDFKPQRIVMVSGAPTLDKVNEAGEVTFGTISDAGMSWQTSTYAKAFAYTWQMMVNDDLSGLSDIVSKFGVSAMRLEESLAYLGLTSNRVMEDGVVCFHANHGNLLTGAGSALSYSQLQAGRLAMRLQRGMSPSAGQQGPVLNLRPRTLLVPAALESLAYQLTSAEYSPSVQSNISEFRAGGRAALDPVVSAELDATSSTAWYLLGSSADDTVRYAYLEGYETPQIETFEESSTLGASIRCVHNFAATAVNWRAMVKSNGA